MSFNQFMMKVANWLANEVVVKRLANSKAFQSAALRTHLTIEKQREAAKQAMESVVDGAGAGAGKQLPGGGAGAGGMRKPPRGGVLGFFSAFRKEVAKDVGL
ncbi:hypothetical protein TeGR_g1186 [Tetraparma gracilis]|uniref:Uncharacterized protein n=1 Tax=Tetraparma gracilis TaxID=2962635 RepID=A0ABQ6NB67_9STRA|nr:hypothetical protein TeGR_g1186 [Tetraparma gracilis]